MSAPAKIRETLTALGVTPRKQRGQNFLIDPGSVHKVLSFAGVRATDEVVEVGPGLGALTTKLIEQAKTYCAVDIEERFIQFLRSEHPALPPSSFICADVRTINLSELGFSPERKAVIVSNVPYSLSSEVILWLLEQHTVIARASLLLQREFAERVAAVPGGKEYGSLSALSALLADIRLGPKITGACFFPPAEVESRLVELRMLGSTRYEVPSVQRFETVVRASFSKRRKTLLNALSSSERFGSKDDVESWLRRCDIDPVRRAETVSPEEYARMTRFHG